METGARSIRRGGLPASMSRIIVRSDAKEWKSTKNGRKFRSKVCAVGLRLRISMSTY